jgi:hypothetical protein
MLNAQLCIFYDSNDSKMFLHHLPFVLLVLILQLTSHESSHLQCRLHIPRRPFSAALIVSQLSTQRISVIPRKTAQYVSSRRRPSLCARSATTFSTKTASPHGCRHSQWARPEELAHVAERSFSKREFDLSFRQATHGRNSCIIDTKELSQTIAYKTPALGP